LQNPVVALQLDDLRSQPLLAAYHASVQLHKAADELSRAELAAQVRHRWAAQAALFAHHLVTETPDLLLVAVVVAVIRVETLVAQVSAVKYDLPTPLHPAPPIMTR
jgi:hypothetical protein